MSSSSEALLDHIADFLKFISSAQSFWFSLNTSYDHGCHLASCFCLDPDKYEVVSPLVAPTWCRLVVPSGCRIVSCRPLIAPHSLRLIAPAGGHIASRRPLIALPSRRLVTPAGCRIASCCPHFVPPSCQLVAPACCCIASPRPLVAPRPALSSSRRAGWLLHGLSARRPLVVSSSHRAASHCLIAPAGCRIIISRRPLVAPPSCPLIVLAGCCVACPCAALSSSRRSPSPTPSNTVKCCCRNRTPLPPLPLNAVSIVYHPPLPQLPPIATVERQRPPSSIIAVKR